MQAGRGTVLPPVGVAFEGDLGSRIDAVLAVAMLNGLVAKGAARRIALCVSTPSLQAAQLADVLGAFYRGNPAGPVGGGGVGQNPEAMIGMPEHGASTAAPLAAVLSKKAADGTPVYTSSITRLLDTADNAVLIRNVLLAQHDQNAAIVVAGPTTGLARLVGLYGARPQIATKARQLVLAAGSFAAGRPDPSIASDVAAARRLFAEWPTPIVVVGAEVGDALPYPASSIETDFGWAPAHPVADAYRVAKAMPYDAPASALAAVLYAVHANDGYFTLSDPGTITVLDDGRTQFTPGPGGKHRHLIVDPAQKDRIIKLYTELVAARPAPRPGRGGRGAVPPPAPPARPVPPPNPAGVKPPTP